jgi:rfaE bifunctional protein nucleotidyltransferase chain/domain
MGSVVNRDDLLQTRILLRQHHKKVVFTNGCFDILHRGHIEYLQQAKALGDILIVGVNSDSSMRRIKGAERPIVGAEDRLFIVANLCSVDYVCQFDEDTPLQLITALLPDILVKGADWQIDAIVGKDIVEKNGGRVATIDFLPNRSSSGIIKRILERYSNR